jgi:hypothetical protein
MKLRFCKYGIEYAFKNDYAYRLIGFGRVKGGKLQFRINWLTFDAVKKENRI